MRIRTLITMALIALCSVSAVAELQQVEVGGSIRIRGNYYNLDSLGSYSFVEQRTRLNVKADFTDDVSAFIEFDYYDMWGEDFRSNYLTGADFRAGQNDVDLFQAYIRADNLWGTPLSLRVGRQEFRLGGAFFIGTNESSAFFTGHSYDALLLTYGHEQFVLHAVGAKTVERHGDFFEDDADLYGVYFSYLGIENVTLDAYWLYARDRVGAMGNKVDLHTLGLRGAGAINGFDFDLEAAYQFGNVYGVPKRGLCRRGNADVDFDEWGVNTEVGYTFDVAWQPRVFARFAYLGGGSMNSRSNRGSYDMPFIRLASDVVYSEFLDNDARTGNKATLSNILFYSLGVQASPVECLDLKVNASFYEVDKRVNRASSSLGWELGLSADYHYSEDLVVRAGYAHFFGKRGLESNTIINSGLLPWGGNRRDDYDLVFIETEIKF